jgi:tRNA(Ile)-lysidine synthase
MAEDALLRSFKEFVHTHRLFTKGDVVLVAVSGGRDSVTLLDLLVRLKKDWHLTVAVAHFNHRLRGEESEGDEEFVKSRARFYDIACYNEGGDTALLAEAKKKSIQETAREMRYAFFNSLLDSLDAKSLATAHHAEDNAETIVFNLIRGAGVQGLSGIPVKRSDVAIIRPLLFATRTEIEGYVGKHGLPFREDSSNAKTDYTRNFIRKNVLPIIEENINPNLSRTLLRTGEHFRALEEFLAAETEKARAQVVRSTREGEVALRRVQFMELPTFLQYRLLRELICEYSGRELDFSTLQNALRILSSGTGGSADLFGDVGFARDRDRLILRKHAGGGPFRCPIEMNRSYDFPAFSFASSLIENRETSVDRGVECVDGDKLTGDICLRSWEKGDWFIPLGMKGKKKLSDFFIEQKIPRHEKESIPVLIAGANVVWVCGRRLDDRFKVTERTRRVFKLEFVRKNGPESPKTNELELVL